MRRGGKELELLAGRGDEVIDTHREIPHPFFISGHIEKPKGLDIEETWLNPDVVEPERLLPLLKPYPANKMEEWRVGVAARTI
jgi:hypothetical protein